MPFLKERAVVELQANVSGGHVSELIFPYSRAKVWIALIKEFDKEHSFNLIPPAAAPFKALAGHKSIEQPQWYQDGLF